MTSQVIRITAHKDGKLVGRGWLMLNSRGWIMSPVLCTLEKKPKELEAGGYELRLEGEWQLAVITHTVQ